MFIVLEVPVVETLSQHQWSIDASGCKIPCSLNPKILFLQTVPESTQGACLYLN